MNNITPLQSHTKRLIQTLDALYEFGPTHCDQWEVSSIAEYERVANTLTLEKISYGLKLCQDLAGRKRVAPNPEEFLELCTR